MLFACFILLSSPFVAAEAELVGFTALPADSFAVGPNAGGDDGTGNPVSANGRTGPFTGQPIQGFSAVQFSSQHPGSFWFLSDNGFGTRVNSSDYLLRIYRLRPDFRTANSPGYGVVVEEFIQLADPNGKVPFTIINENTAGRLLTGSDFDIESFVIDRNGDIWVGDEFGPFMLHFDASGTLLQAPISTPGITSVGSLDHTIAIASPDNPYLKTPADANIGRSGGFEGLAFEPGGQTMYPLLEKSVEDDPADALRIYEFRASQPGFTNFVGFYQKTNPGNAIGEFTPVNNEEYLIIERDSRQGDAAQFKKIYKINITSIDSEGYVAKQELVDLLNISDPNDLNNDGSTTFDFPFSTIEVVLVMSEDTILVANDNNFPFSIGRGPDIDNSEIILLKVDSLHPLDADGDGIINTIDIDDDNDGLADASETNTGTFISSHDTGTDPLQADTDGDSFNDGIEIARYTNPLKISSYPAPDGDLAPPDVPDGRVDMADYLRMYRIVLGEVIPGDVEYAHGDVYPPGEPDSAIDLSDLLLLQTRLLGRSSGCVSVCEP